MKFYSFLLILALGACKYSHNSIRINENKLNRIDTSYALTDASVLKTIQPYSDSIQGLMNKVLCHSEVLMDKNKPEGLLGNFISDAFFDYVRGSFLPKEPLCVVLNNGGLRSSLPQGGIKTGKVFETLPFDNQLVILKLRIDQMDTMVDRIINSNGEPVSNLWITKLGDQVKWEVRNSGASPTYIYVATSDYLADGNSGFSVFTRAEQAIPTGFNLRDILVLQMQYYSQRNINIHPKIEGRITIE